MRRTQLLSTVALATSLSFVPTTAFAQDAGAEEPAAQDDSEGLDVIVVTATRRSENLQDIPLSVATVDDDTLSAINSGGADIRGLAGRVPSLNIESSFGRTFPRFYIRGLGNTDFDLNASQPVSLIYDEVVLENPILKGFPVFDMDRVEVLRGPQGTTFGRNTPAGIVKFDTVRPGDGRSYVKASYGRYDSVNLEAAADGQLTNDLAVRVSGMFQSRDDWINNIATTQDGDLGGFNEFAARVQLAYEPHDDLAIRLTGQHRDLNGSARAFRANLFNTGSNELVGLDGGDFERDQIWTDAKNFQTLRTKNISLAVETGFGENARLYSITSYWHGKLESRGDIDGGFGAVFLPESGPGFIPFPAQSQDNIPDLDQFTQEVRIASDYASGLNYQAGVFFFDENLSIESFDFSNPQDTAPAAIVNQLQTSNALGVFGSLSYAFDNGLTLQGGLRWNQDEKKLVADRLFDARPGFVGGGPVPESTTFVEDEVLTWDASAIYEINPDVNVYARVAKGYRAPAIQGRILFDRDVTTADSEETMSYEAGVKTVLLDNRVRFNLTGYYFETDNLQLSAVGGAANANLLLNADKVEGKGFEAELQARPARGLTFTAGVSYNDTEIQDSGLTVETCGAPCTVTDPIAVPAAPFQPAIVFIDGNALPQAPKWTLNFTAGYAHPVGNGEIYAFTDWYHRSKINFFLYEAVEFSDDKLTEGGVRLGYRNDKFDIAGFVRNITDDESAVSGIDFNNLTGMVNEPRIYGVEFGVKF
ncbi:TonB-dependent receptor [Sphingomicrobium clamense]|uniref:TonB-dependent receptor n=1 Tax=Sphingomicrobium clamense TaxID=2851013 RepID=A0ABS6V447_9SPHN|nr:TonB-dependent receptor [Sphingomicrobium sp. B8]MBW0144331.1 TonB-dependent receptor [Sphingomicrobium sp. B8]